MSQKWKVDNLSYGGIIKKLRPRGWKWPVKPQIASIFKLDVRKRLDSPEFVMSHGNEIVFSFNGI